MSAKRLLDPESEGYFRAASEQTTVKPWRKAEYSSVTAPYTEILNEKGMELFEKTARRVAEGDYKDEIIGYSTFPVDSGSWTADFSNPKAKFFMEVAYDPGLVGMRCTKFNEFVGGYFVKAKSKMVTSCCVFIIPGTQDKPGWCLTMNGSVYLLKNEV